MELRQKSKQEETDRRKVEERRRRERENLAGLREALGSLRKEDKLDVQVRRDDDDDVMMIVTWFNIYKESARKA